MEFLFTGNQPDSVYNNVFYAQERSLVGSKIVPKSCFLIGWARLECIREQEERSIIIKVKEGS